MVSECDLDEDSVKMTSASILEMVQIPHGKYTCHSKLISNFCSIDTILKSLCTIDLKGIPSSNKKKVNNPIPTLILFCLDMISTSVYQNSSA